MSYDIDDKGIRRVNDTEDLERVKNYRRKYLGRFDVRVYMLLFFEE